MRIASSIAIGLAVCVVAASSGNNYNPAPEAFLAGRVYGSNSHRSAYLNNEEHALEYSAKLLSKIAEYASVKAADSHAAFMPSEIQLADLGLDSSGSAKRVKDLFGTVHMRLSDRYQFTFDNGVKSENGGKDMLSMPFSDVFTLDPSGIRYMSNVLSTLSRLDIKSAGAIAPMFGVSSKRLHIPGAAASVANLLRTIGGMEKNSLDYIAKSSIDATETDDPLSKRTSIFSLSNLLAMENQRVNEVAEFFSSISHVRATDIAKYMHSIGWRIEGGNKGKSSGSAANGIPNINFMFLMDDSTLSSMSQAARQYAAGASEGSIADVRRAVEARLDDVRDLLDFIPGYSNLSSLVGLASNPVVNAISQIISLSYKYPNASYFDLALLYYKNIGMPGLQNIINYPSQYVGSIASTLVGATTSIPQTSTSPTSTPSAFASAISSSSSSSSTSSTSLPASSPSSTLTSSSTSAGGIWGWFSNLGIVNGVITAGPTAMAAVPAPISTPKPSPSSLASTSTSTSTSSSTSSGGIWGWFSNIGAGSGTSIVAPTVTPTAPTRDIPGSLSSVYSSLSSSYNSLSSSYNSSASKSSTKSSKSSSTSSSSTSTSSSTSSGGIWAWPSNNGVGSGASTAAPTAMAAVPAPAPKTTLKGVAATKSSSTKAHPYEATLDLNKQSSTRVTYTLNQGAAPPTFILTVIPRPN
ncbi:hypothetical protein BX070DRAFT_219263 [Coemansia spiralis]|nr:hypothetical protein BX070DRAFT_219263 [Coemansia spiralis]